MFHLASLTNKQRLTLGIVLLIFVDLIWVGSSELTEYIFKDENYRKPYFTTYLKTTMFVLYLLGFLFCKGWRQRCSWGLSLKSSGNRLLPEAHLSQPMYVPIKDPDDGYSSIDSMDTEPTVGLKKSVRFKAESEVRVMNDAHAEEACLARLSYNEYLRKRMELTAVQRQFPVPFVCKLALVFSILWFLASFAYQEALLFTEAGIVNALSSTSGLFTLVLAAIWSSGPMDKFTLSKLLAVLVSLGGTVMVCMSDSNMELKFPGGAVWALFGALAYALYLVTLRKKVKDEERLDIPMFFGFVGLFNLLMLWPGFLILNYTKWEEFAWPSTNGLILILINGLIGTVLSELLWLWGCFLTSSLIGTLALGLTTPLTMMFDVFIKQVSYGWMFYAGVVPVFISFLAVAALSHYENWDPVMLLFRSCFRCLNKVMKSARLKELDTELNERLLIRTEDAE